MNALGMGSLAGTLDALSGFVPVALASPGAWARARAMVAALPAALTTRLYLECPLAGGGARADVIVRVDRQRAPLAATGGALPEALAAHPIWSRLRAFCDRWTDPADPLHAAVHHLWLEFDAPDTTEATLAVPLPSVFVNFEASAAAAARPGRVALDTVRALVGEPLAPGVAAGVERAFRSLPRAAAIPYLGVMFPRGLDRLRLCVSGLAGGDRARYLHGVGWRGPAGSLEAAVGAARGAGNHSAPGLLHLDVGGTAGGSIGLEFPFARRSQLRGRLEERGFLEHLVARRLCAAAACEGLLGWPGWSWEELPHELWPSLLFRRLNHVKLVHAPGRPPEAKAYLCAFHEYRRGPRRSAREPHLYPVEADGYRRAGRAAAAQHPGRGGPARDLL